MSAYGAALRTVLPIPRFPRVAIQPIERFVPGPLEGLDPIADRPERLGVDAITPPATDEIHRDNSRPPQDTQVLRDRWLRQAKRGHQLAHSPKSTAGEQFQNLPSPRVGDRIENIRWTVALGHRHYHIPFSAYINMRVSHFNTSQNRN